MIVTDYSIIGQVDRVSATESVDSGSIAAQIKPKALKIGVYSFPSYHLIIKGTVQSFHVCGRQVGWWPLDSMTKKFLRCLLAKATFRINVIAITPAS